jgi:hypothetical protein
MVRVLLRRKERFVVEIEVPKNLQTTKRRLPQRRKVLYYCGWWW